VKIALKGLVAGIGLVVALASASAAEFHTYAPGSGQLKVNNPSGGAGFGSVSVTGYTGVGGQFNGNFWSGGAMPADSFFQFFCIELGQYSNAGPNTYTASILSDDDLRKLYDVAYPNKSAGDFWNGGQTTFGGFPDATAAAAFQVAVWNIVFDNDLSLSGGSFQWTGALTSVSTAAQALLNQVANYSGNGYQRWTLYRFDSASYQNYVSATYAVPEPATIGLLGIALAAFGIASRRRRG
jgi:hypothetical protein